MLLLIVTWQSHFLIINNAYPVYRFAFHPIILLSMKNPDWFKLKSYPHIGHPITWRDANIVRNYITNPKKIITHSFCPFIHTQIYTPKYRKEYDEWGNLLNQGKRVRMDVKVRDIYYANHCDANIFSYYSFLLSEKYEQVLDRKNLKVVVTAYRRIPLKENKDKPNKCNIDFADDIFNYIRQNSKNGDLVAITFDIKGFFDNLNHKLLQEAWYDLWDIKDLNGHLPKDHYQVFKAITKFSYVEDKALFALFKDEIIIKTKSGKIRTKLIKKIDYLRNQKAIAYCELKDLKKIRANGLIRANKFSKNNKILRDYGICQGSPISAILANIYMLEFDEFMNQQILDMQGIYRRYSDDMVIICPNNYRNKFLENFEYYINKITKLKIQASKTQVFHFKRQDNQLICLQEFNGTLNENSDKRKFEYLGFSFDGKNVYLKTTALAKYYRKMKQGVKRSAYYTNRIDNKTQGEMFVKRLYNQYSYIGAKPNKSFYRIKGTTNQWIGLKTNNWGNFIGYAQKASRRIKGNKIKYQIKNHWKNLDKEIKKYPIEIKIN